MQFYQHAKEALSKADIPASSAADLSACVLSQLASDLDHGVTVLYHTDVASVIETIIKKSPDASTTAASVIFTTKKYLVDLTFNSVGSRLVQTALDALVFSHAVVIPEGFDLDAITATPLEALAGYCAALGAQIKANKAAADEKPTQDADMEVVAPTTAKPRGAKGAAEPFQGSWYEAIGHASASFVIAAAVAATYRAACSGVAPRPAVGLVGAIVRAMGVSVVPAGPVPLTTLATPPAPPADADAGGQGGGMGAGTVTRAARGTAMRAAGTGSAAAATAAAMRGAATAATPATVGTVEATPVGTTWEATSAPLP